MKFKEFLKTGRGKLAAALAALAVSWMFLLWQFSGSISDLFPGEERLAALRSDVKKLRQENAALRLRQKQADALKLRQKELCETYWQNSRDGAAETAIRSRIQAAAKQADLTLAGLGSVKTAKISNELYYAEIDLQTTGGIEPVAKFLAQLRDRKPALAWRRLELRIDMRPRGNDSENTSSISLNGALRVIGYEPGSSPATEVKK